MVDDKEQKSAVVIDVAIPADSNTVKKEHEIIEKYQRLKEQLKQMWKVEVQWLWVTVSEIKFELKLEL